MDNYNVKSYGIVTTDGFVSVGAPMMDTDYATKYWVKKYLEKQSGQVDLSNYYTKQEIDDKGYITEVPSDVVTYTMDDSSNVHLDLPSSASITVDTTSGSKTFAYTDQIVSSEGGESYDTFSYANDFASGNSTITEEVFDRLSAARNAKQPIVVTMDLAVLPTSYICVIKDGTNEQQQMTLDVEFPVVMSTTYNAENYDVSQRVLQIDNSYNVSVVNRSFTLKKEGDGSMFLADDGAYKPIPTT